MASSSTVMNGAALGPILGAGGLVAPTPAFTPSPTDSTTTISRAPSPSPTEQQQQQHQDGSDEDSFYGDQDDAQSFIQPAISEVATRLISPYTPAAERAAAMDTLPGGGLFVDAQDETVKIVPANGYDPNTGFNYSLVTADGPVWGVDGSSTPNETSSGNSHPAASLEPLPTPWRAGPRQMVITEPTNSRTATGMPPVVRMDSRPGRSSSFSENALKRLSRALPSISIPTPSFFLSNLSLKDTFGTQQPLKSAPPPTENGGNTTFPRGLAPTQGPSKTGSLKSRSLHKSTSDDSLLYHSLSRVSSLGDDDRFINVREQVNARFKAIKDSWDAPSFKLPQLPNILNNTPLKKNGTASSDHLQDAYRSGSFPNGAKAQRDDVHPLDAVLENLTGDIVVLGGYRGSVLRSAQPPYRQLWVPVKVGLNIRKVNMEVGLDPEDEEKMEEHIFASGMLQNIGPVDISRRLFKKLRDCENAKNGKLRVHDYGYDWRLSPHLLSRKLNEFLAKLPSNQPHMPKENRGAWVIAHSLGGLITRHAVNQRPELFAGVLYAGVPQRCINILGPLRNGDAVLLNEKVLTAQVNFSLRTTFVFLPEDGYCFVDKTTKEEYPIDFYNVDDWIKYRLCPCIGEPALPALSRSNGAFGSLLNLSDSLPSLPLRGRSNSSQKKSSGSEGSEPWYKASLPDVLNGITKDRTLAPQMGSSSAATTNQNHNSYRKQSQEVRSRRSQSSPTRRSAATQQQGTRGFTIPQPSTTTPPPETATDSPFPTKSSSSPTTTTILNDQSRNLAYLRRTLAQTKQFRSELAHNPAHQSSNVYPPLGVIYAKDIPTVYAARVAGRLGIACADAYDDLVFGSGDGVVLAREAMLPQGYELARGGRVCTDRGHISLLGDLVAVGRALDAVVRGRGKGIGLGVVQ